MNKAQKILLYVSGALTGIICVVMNAVLIPKIESSTEGIRCFDMNFAYSYETAQKFLSLLSEEGKRIYLTVQLPLDFIYPIAYCIFFVLLIIALQKKKTALIALPLVLTFCDYCENICTILMLKADTLSPSLVTAASIFTSAKTVLMYLVFLVIIVLIVIRVKNRKKETVA